MRAERSTAGADAPPGPRVAEVPARAALAGNPSDGYGGAVLAASLPGLRARVSASRGPSGGAVDGIAPGLLRAVLADAGGPPVTLRASTSIPREVGLAGSSALVLAALRALGAAEEGVALARRALRIEEAAGLAAGLQDRVTQVLAGAAPADAGAGAGAPVAVAMDFADARFARLDAPAPGLVVAWRSDGAASSGIVHRSLRARHAAGEPSVRAAMLTLRELGLAAEAALVAGDRAALGRAMQGSLDARASCLRLDPAVSAMAAICRSHAAPVNQAGSGGAIVALAPPDPRALVAALADAGCGVAVIP